MVRIRAVEFLSEAYKVFWKDLHSILAESDLYNTLLFYFDHYPYHNILHQKVCEIFMLPMEKNHDVIIIHLLDKTDLLKKILNTSSGMGNGEYTFQGTGLTLNRGYITFVRKLANKISDLKKSNQEVSNILDSIPEWSDYYEQDLVKANEIESKPLGQDPRQKEGKGNSTDEYFDFIFKFKDPASGRKTSGEGGQQQDDDDDDEEEEDIKVETMEEDPFAQNNPLGGTMKVKSRNGTSKRQSYADQNDDDDDEEDDFERMM